jgi:hypothetical protein
MSYARSPRPVFSMTMGINVDMGKLKVEGGFVGRLFGDDCV